MHVYVRVCMEVLSCIEVLAPLYASDSAIVETLALIALAISLHYSASVYLNARGWAFYIFLLVVSYVYQHSCSIYQHLMLCD